MATRGDNLLRKTQRGFSILAFETTKQSRILKKRMRAAALQKEIKADLRDLGNLVYNALLKGQTDVLGDEEVRILVENLRRNKDEVDRLRDAVARLSRARKQFGAARGEEWTQGPVPPSGGRARGRKAAEEAEPSPAAHAAADPAVPARKASRKREEKEDRTSEAAVAGPAVRKPATGT